MKKTLALLLSLTFAAGVSAQSNTAYFMEGSTLRSQLNPALAPQRGYFNIPGVAASMSPRTATSPSATCSSRATESS